MLFVFVTGGGVTFSRHHDKFACGICGGCGKPPLGYHHPHSEPAGGGDALIIHRHRRILHCVDRLQYITSRSAVS